VDRIAAQIQRGHGQRSAADAHGRGHGADDSRERHPARAFRHFPRDAQIVERQQHFRGDQQRHGAEHAREHRLRRPRGDRAAAQRARDHPCAPAFREIPVDGAARVVRARGHDRRRDDRRERRRDRDVHGPAIGDAGEAQAVFEDGHGDDAATHAQHSGHETREHSRRGEHGDERQQARERGRVEVGVHPESRAAVSSARGTAV
jgi:hypothetical protein